MSWRNASIFCCSKGQSLLAIKSAEEFKCIQTFQDGMIIIKIPQIQWMPFFPYVFKDPEVAGHHFWTSASGQNCQSTFVWCGSGERQTLGDKDPAWLPEEINHNHDKKVALLYFSRTTTSTGLRRAAPNAENFFICDA
jgi:hypothetical protein